MPPRSLLGKPQKAKFPTWPGRPAGPQNVLVFCPLLRSPFPPKGCSCLFLPQAEAIHLWPHETQSEDRPVSLPFLIVSENREAVRPVSVSQVYGYYTMVH